MKFYRINPNEDTVPATTNAWYDDFDEYPELPGTSCCASYDSLVSYMSEANPDLSGAYLMELEGELVGECHDGECRVDVAAIVKSTPIGETSFIFDVEVVMSEDKCGQGDDTRVVLYDHKKDMWREEDIRDFMFLPNDEEIERAEYALKVMGAMGYKAQMVAKLTKELEEACEESDD